MAVTIISGVVGGVDSVAKEIKINKLEKQIKDIKKYEYISSTEWNDNNPEEVYFKISKRQVSYDN